MIIIVANPFLLSMLGHMFVFSLVFRYYSTRLSLNSRGKHQHPEVKAATGDTWGVLFGREVQCILICMRWFHYNNECPFLLLLRLQSLWGKKGSHRCPVIKGVCGKNWMLAPASAFQPPCVVSGLSASWRLRNARLSFPRHPSSSDFPHDLATLALCKKGMGEEMLALRFGLYSQPQ